LAEAVETIEISVAEKPPDELVEYISAMQVKAFPKLSSIELDDIRIPGMYPILR
jgi:protein CMS1